MKFLGFDPSSHLFRDFDFISTPKFKMVLADSPLAGTRRVGGILPRREKGKVCRIRTQNPEILGEILTTLTAPLKEQVKWHEIQGICTRYGEVDNTRWSCALSHRQRCFSLLYHRAHRAHTVCAPHIFFPLLLLSVRTCFRSGYC